MPGLIVPAPSATERILADSKMSQGPQRLEADRDGLCIVANTREKCQATEKLSGNGCSA